MLTRKISEILVLLAFLFVGCGPTSQPVTVTLTPNTATLTPGEGQTFTATVTNTADTRVTWTATAGTITPNGAASASSRCSLNRPKTPVKDLNTVPDEFWGNLS